MSGFRNIIRSALGTVGASTLASRVLGLLRDMAMAHFFGTGMVAEAFYVAFMIPNLLRRLVGEGSLTVAFIPVFTKLKQERGEDEAKEVLASFFTLMTMVLAVMVALGVVFSREIVALFVSPQFQYSAQGAETEKFTLAAAMTAQMFPYLFLIGLTALSMGVLNSYKRFFAPAFHPVLLNAAWIASLFIFHDRFEQAGMSAVAGVLMGGVLQLGLQIPFLAGVGMKFMPRFNFRHPAILRIGRLMLPSTFAVGIVQVNTLIATYFVTAFEGGRSQLYYANRWTEFPYATFSLALAVVILPTLSEQAGKGDREGLRNTLAFGLRMAAFIIIPASIGLALLARPVVHLFYEHGEFIETANTANMLVMFCVGLWATAFLRLVVQAYYAIEDMMTPVWSAAVAMIANAAGCFGLPQLMGRSGVPLAISLASVVNFAILWALLPGKVGSFGRTGLARTIGTSLLACVPMAALVYWLGTLSLWDQPGMKGMKALLLAAQLTGGGGLYFACAALLRAEELWRLIDAMRAKVSGGQGGSG